MIITKNQIMISPGLCASTDPTGITLMKGRGHEAKVIHLTETELREILLVAVTAGLWVGGAQ